MLWRSKQALFVVTSAYYLHIEVSVFLDVNLLQVGKMALYAASSAIREIQKLALDPMYVNRCFFFSFTSLKISILFY